MDGKRCTKCEEIKPFIEFYKKKQSKDGHRSECKQCTTMQNDKYRRDNIEKVKDCKRKYRDENRENIKKKNAEYRETNRELIRKRARDWAIKKRDKTYGRKYYLLNKDYISKRNNTYAKENSLKRLIREQRRRAKIKDLPTGFTEKDWIECLIFFDQECSYCGKKLATLQQDHFIPVDKGGGYLKENIVPACPSCNASKRNKRFEEWYRTTEDINSLRVYKIYYYLNYFVKGVV
jgi:hypothetical protein